MLAYYTYLLCAIPIAISSTYIIFRIPYKDLSKSEARVIVLLGIVIGLCWPVILWATIVIITLDLLFPKLFDELANKYSEN